MTLPVDARLCRGVDVDIHLLKVYADGSQHVGYGIVALTFQVEAHRGQQPFDGGLVDDPLVELVREGVGEYRELTQ